MLVETPVPHQEQRDKPLLVFTKYKMYGLASIGHGLLFQQGMFKAMAKKVDRTMEILRGASLGPLIEPTHLEAVRCCFLDLTGAEEIGTLILTRNYSVAMSLVLAMKSLTFGDLFDVEPTLQGLLAESPVHRSIWAQLTKTVVGADLAARIRSNHVFQWTQSSLAVSPQILQSCGVANCHGFIEAATQLQVAPGHHVSAERTAAPIGLDASHRQVAEQVRQTGYHGFLVGTSDLVLLHGVDVDATATASARPTTANEDAGSRGAAATFPCCRLRRLSRVSSTDSIRLTFLRTPITARTFMPRRMS